MLNCILSYLILSTATGSAFSLTVPIPREKTLEWNPPVVISREVFPSHSSSHRPPYLLPHNEYKEIIGIELQRIPFHEGPEHGINEHQKHEILQPVHEPHEAEFFKPHVPPEVIEPEILTHEYPPPNVLPNEDEEFEYHPHDFHDILEHEQRELKEQERRQHEIMAHEYAHEHEILEREHKEHDVLAHELLHERRRPPWEDPDFALSEAEHHHEHEHEFHHEELFPEVSGRRTNRRRESGSREMSSRRNNSNSNRRETSNRRESSNRRENNNRRENPNRQGSSRREGGSNINTEELFPRRNSQNNNRRNNNNNNNNRRNNDNREGTRRNSNIEELSALEEETSLNSEETVSHKVSRPERDVSYFNNEERETSFYESSIPRQSDSNLRTFGFGSNAQTLNRPSSNDFQTKFSDQQGFIAGDSVLSQHQRRFDGENTRRYNDRNEEPVSTFKQERPTFSNSNQGFSNTNFEPFSNLNENSNSDSSYSRPDLPSTNIFIQEEEYLNLDNSNSQRPISRPTGFNHNNNNNNNNNSNNNNNNNNNEQDWDVQKGPTSASSPGYSNSFGLNGSEEFSNVESSRPSYLGSRPGSGKPTVPGSLSGQNSTKPNRPETTSTGFYTSEDHRPNRPSSSSSGSYSTQESRPRPESDFSGLYSSQNKKPSQFDSNSSGFNPNQEKPGRPTTGFSEHYTPFEERPSQPGDSSFVHFSSQGNSRPSYQSNSQFSSSEHSSRPNRPSSRPEEENSRPYRPSSRPEEENSRPYRPSSRPEEENSRPYRPSSRPEEENSRPYRPSSRPEEDNSRPRPSNGNNLNNESDPISVQEDSWLWPNQSQDEDKQNRRTLYPNGNKKHSTSTKRPTATGSSNKKHSNLKLLPMDSCGVDLGNKIIGGENTQLDEFPWMALLQHSSAEGRVLGFGCGGSLISPRYVLTAAHCIKGPAIGKNVRVTKVRLGEFDTSTDVDCQGELCSPSPVDVAVEEIIVHPKYRATDRAQLNDIALIRLNKNVQSSAYVAPICLPVNGNNDHVGEKLVVAGWGKTSNGQNGASSKTKQKVSVPVISLEECSPFYNRINIQLNGTQMCAGGERGKDSCQGDSGGPLMGSEIIDNQIRWQVHGIVSFGPEDCGIDNVAGVYTKVSEYIDWILDNMKR